MFDIVVVSGGGGGVFLVGGGGGGGNIINDVNNTYVLTTYLFIWIPAGICLLATVLAFNLVGDGLRDAFDPKMKR